MKRGNAGLSRVNMFITRGCSGGGGELSRLQGRANVRHQRTCACLGGRDWEALPEMFCIRRCQCLWPEEPLSCFTPLNAGKLEKKRHRKES